MSEDPGYELVRRVALLSAATAVVGGLGAWWRGGPSPAWGYVGGVVLGVVSLTGVALMVYGAILPPGERRRERKGAAIPVSAQLLKYAVLIAGLYLLVAHYKLNECAIFFGLLTPVALATALTLRLISGKRFTHTGQ